MYTLPYCHGAKTWLRHSIECTHIYRLLAGSLAQFHIRSVGGQPVTMEHLQKAMSTELLFQPDRDCGLGILANGESLTRREVAFAQARANGIHFRRRSNPLSWLFAQSSRGTSLIGNASRNSDGSVAVVIIAADMAAKLANRTSQASSNSQC